MVNVEIFKHVKHIQCSFCKDISNTNKISVIMQTNVLAT